MRITKATTGHIDIAIRALLASGWRITQAPSLGRLQRNQQLVTLDGGNQASSLRLLVYKVTKSSRGRDRERRVEITSTYGHGLDRIKGVSDVVLGYDPNTRAFVGLDPQRLQHGGETSNASSFLEPEGLWRTKDTPFLVLARQTSLFPKGELQAFLRPERLGEYLLNVASIHGGSYPVQGRHSNRAMQTGWATRSLGSLPDRKCSGDRLILMREPAPTRRSFHLTDKARRLANEAIDLRQLPRDVTPKQLEAIQRRQAENGLLGEEFVYEYEKTVLRKLGKMDLANRVEWVSKRTVSAGYDIKSFDPKTGELKYIEVKSCHIPSTSFFATVNEWKTARRFGEQYVIYRIVNVRDKPRVTLKLQNPVSLERQGRLKLSEASWKVTVLDNND